MVRYTREPSEVRVWTMAEVVRPIAAVVWLIALVTLYCTLSMDRYLYYIHNTCNVHVHYLLTYVHTVHFRERET